MEQKRVKGWMIALCFCFIAIFSCKKRDTVEMPVPRIDVKVKSALAKMMQEADYERLDFEHTAVSGNGLTCYYGIPLKTTTTKTREKLLLKTNATGDILASAIIKVTPGTYNALSRFEGEIVISSINRSARLQSGITEGRIVALRDLSPNAKDPVVPSNPGEYLPEVVVIGYLPDDSNNISEWNIWVSAQYILSALGNNSGGTDSWGDLPGGGTGGGAGSNDQSTNPGGYLPLDPVPAQNVSIEWEPEYDVPTVDLEAYFKCFESIPDDGSTYTITMNVDVPNNQYPSLMLSFGGIGHTFLTVGKSNNGQSIQQTFGFYSQTPIDWKKPIQNLPSRIGDNGGREVNASITMNITAEQFKTIKAKALALRSKLYNLGEYNCGQYVLDVLNTVRTTPISVEPVTIFIPAISVMPEVEMTIHQSPQKIFALLKSLAATGDPDGGAITIDQSHDRHAPISHGPCQ